MSHPISFPQVLNALLEGKRVRGKSWVPESWLYLDDRGKLMHSGGFPASGLEATIPYEILRKATEKKEVEANG